MFTFKDSAGKSVKVLKGMLCVATKDLLKSWRSWKPNPLTFLVKQALFHFTQGIFLFPSDDPHQNESLIIKF